MAPQPHRQPGARDPDRDVRIAGPGGKDPARRPFDELEGLDEDAVARARGEHVDRVTAGPGPALGDDHDHEAPEVDGRQPRRVDGALVQAGPYARPALLPSDA